MYSSQVNSAWVLTVKSAEIEANLLLTIEPDTDNAVVGKLFTVQPCGICSG